jgi:RNA polymerase sigma-70 factor, ECF subfamily
MCDQATGRQLDDSPVSDDTLAERARAGSGAAFAALVTLHGEAVYAIARNMSVTPRDAEEVIKETFLSAWRDLGSFPAGVRVTTWLYGIAMKTALAQREAQRRNPWGSLEGLLPSFDRAGRLVATRGRWAELDDGPSERPAVTGLLREALECIDDRTRAAYVLRDLVRLPVEEVAVILDASPQGVSADAHRACLMLRGFIDGL